MYSIKFPDMLSSVETNLTLDHPATSQNLLLMLKSDKGSLFGDPYFGTIIKKMLYDQNNIVLHNLLIDELYTSIVTFMPQIKLSRNDIRLSCTKEAIYVTIEALNLIDYQIDLFNIKLTEDE